MIKDIVLKGPWRESSPAQCPFNICHWMINYITCISRCRALRQSAAAGSNTDNFDELTWFLPRQEGSQQERWGLLPDNPPLESSHNLKRTGAYLHWTTVAEQATSKHRYFAPTLRQTLDSSSLSHSLRNWCPFYQYQVDQSKQWPYSASIFNH